MKWFRTRKSTKRPKTPPRAADPVAAIRAHYEPRIATKRENFDVLDWASAHSQRIRFQVLCRNVRLDGKSLLDVGCGLGDLLTFLQRRGIGVAYTGVDLLEKMVAAASRRHPDNAFVCADVFAEDRFAPGSFDVVFVSGMFNLDLGNQAEFLTRALPRLLEIAREHLVFNLLHRRAEFRDDRYAYADPGEVMRILEPLPCEARVVDDYLPNDFTVICRKTAD